MIKELEDYSWFPETFRRFQAEFIGSFVQWFNIYRPLLPEISQMLKSSRTGSVQDLCSGSGLPAIYIQRQLNEKYQLSLSDKYPPVSFKNQATLNYLAQSTDLLVFEPTSDSLYTMFNSFHHFSPIEQQVIIRKMVMAKSSFIIAEILEPGIFNGLKIFFTTTILQLMLTPFVQPFSLQRLLFTYLIPVNLITVTYDGIISVVKSATLQQYRKRFEKEGHKEFEVSVHKICNWKGGIIYIKGIAVR